MRADLGLAVRDRVGRTRSVRTAETRPAWISSRRTGTRLILIPSRAFCARGPLEALHVGTPVDAPSPITSGSGSFVLLRPGGRLHVCPPSPPRCDAPDAYLSPPLSPCGPLPRPHLELHECVKTWRWPVHVTRTWSCLPVPPRDRISGASIAICPIRARSWRPRLRSGMDSGLGAARGRRRSLPYAQFTAPCTTAASVGARDVTLSSSRSWPRSGAGSFHHDPSHSDGRWIAWSIRRSSRPPSVNLVRLRGDVYELEPLRS